MSLHHGWSTGPGLIYHPLVLFCSYCSSHWVRRKLFLSLWLRPVASQVNISWSWFWSKYSSVGLFVWFLCLVGTKSESTAFFTHLHRSDKSYFWYEFYGSTLWKETTCQGRYLPGPESCSWAVWRGRSGLSAKRTLCSHIPSAFHCLCWP